MRNIVKLAIAGQAVWLNYLRRAFIISGELKQALEDGVTGITSSPAIFEKAITHSADYDDYLRELLAKGTPYKDIAYLLAVDDIQRAADLLRPIFEESDRLDGYVTFELDPSTASDSTAMVADARHMLATINRANAMVEIPATTAGIEAIERLVSDGANTNVTHIFSVEDYEKAAQAYLRGLVTYIESHSVWRRSPASVASISINQVDKEVDRQLLLIGRHDLLGAAGLALAKLAYERFRMLFNGPNWDRMVKKGARVQRPKWTRTDPLNYQYPATFYIERLCAPDTIVTVSPKIFNAFKDHGTLTSSLTTNMESAFKTFNALNAAGIDLATIGRELQAKTVSQTNRYHQAFVRSVSQKRVDLESEWKRRQLDVGRYGLSLGKRLEELCEERVMCRIWALDQTVWSDLKQTGVQGLGWMHIVPIMRENIDRIEQFTQSLTQDGINHVIFLGTGETARLPALYSQIFTPWVRATGSEIPLFDINVLDSMHPEAVSAIRKKVKLEHTHFVVTSKTGEEITQSALLHFFFGEVSKHLGPANAGNHFSAITDPESRLATTASQLGFREVFLNDPNINDGFLALSYFGLIPAAMSGIDLDRLLDRTMGMVVNAGGCNSPVRGDNTAAQMGVSIGLMSLEGCDQMLLSIPEPVKPLGKWLEYLITSTLGQSEPRVMPLAIDLSVSPEPCDDDHFIIRIQLNGDVKEQPNTNTLSEAGCPTITYRINDIYDVGALIFTWQMACAVAAYILKIQPFATTQGQASEGQISQLRKADDLEGIHDDLVWEESLAEKVNLFLTPVEAGEYIEIHSFLPPSSEIWAVVEELRKSLAEDIGAVTRVAPSPGSSCIPVRKYEWESVGGYCLILTSTPQNDIELPGTAGELFAGQSLGQLQDLEIFGFKERLDRGRIPSLCIRTGPDMMADLLLLVSDLSHSPEYEKTLCKA